MEVAAMSLDELTRDQITTLKQNMLVAQADRGERDAPSYGELADADEIVSDSAVCEEYAGTDFVPEDF